MHVEGDSVIKTRGFVIKSALERTILVLYLKKKPFCCSTYANVIFLFIYDIKKNNY